MRGGENINQFKIFYKNNEEIVEAVTLLEAREKYASTHKIKRPHEIITMLVAKDGQQITHITDF